MQVAAERITVVVAAVAVATSERRFKGTVWKKNFGQAQS
jgi:hypothetical protein